MIFVPDEIKELFEQDSISKNFRVHFPNGEYRDLVNADFVSESVIFTEAVSSDSKIKFGMAEAPSVEFVTYFNHDIKGSIIYCGIEIDITSLGEDFIEQYGTTSDDVSFPYYFVPYGYFLVDSYTADSNGKNKVVAYQSKLTDKKLENLYVSDPSEFTRIKMMVGASYMRDDAETYSPLQGAYAKIPISELLFSSYPSFSTFLGSSYDVRYDENSPVFNFKNSSPFSTFSDAELHYAENPILKIFWLRQADGFDRNYFIYVRGKKLVFDDTISDFYSHNSYGMPIGNLNNTPTVEWTSNYQAVTTKRMLELPYFLSSDNFYELSWKNSQTLPTREDFTYPEVYDDFIKDNLDYLISPCMIFKDLSTRPTEVAYYGQDGNNTDVYRVNGYFPNGLLTHNRMSTFRDARSKLYSIYLGLPESGPIAEATITQAFVNVSAKQSDGDKYSINIFPKPITIDPSSVDDASKIWNKYYEAVVDTQTTDTWVERPRHIEIGVPTEIVIMSTDIILYPTTYSLLGYPTVGNPDSSYVLETIPINNFTDAHLDQYSFSDEYYNPDIRLGLEIGSAFSNPEYKFPKGEFYPYSISPSANPKPRSSVATASMDTYVVSDVASYFTNYKSIIDFAEINAMLLKADRMDYNSWKFIRYTKLGMLFPNDNLYPDEDIYPTDASIVSRSLWRTLSHSKSMKYPYNKVVCTINQHKYEVSVIDVEDDSDYEQYDISDNWFIKSGYIEEGNILQILWNIANELRGLQYYQLQMTSRSLPYVEAGDALIIVTKDDTVVALNSRQRISGIQSLITDVENH